MTQAIQIPKHYHESNGPKKLKLDGIGVHGDEGYATVSKESGGKLTSVVPLDQLSQFLNHHVQDPVATFNLGDADPQWEELLPHLLKKVHHERFNFTSFTMYDFFRHLSWPTLKRVFPDKDRAVDNWPRFSYTALLEWLKSKAGREELHEYVMLILFRESLADGMHSFVTAIKEVRQ